jgi:hypothetical protein
MIRLLPEVPAISISAATLPSLAQKVAGVGFAIAAMAACAPSPDGPAATGTGAGSPPEFLSGPSMFPNGCGAALPEAGSGLTSDIAMAINPVDGRDVAVAWMQDARADTTSYTIAAAISRNGGATFETFAIPGLSVCTGGVYDVVRDPDLAFDAGGTLYFGAIAAGASTDEPGALLLSHSGDGGRNWEPFTVLETGAPLPEQAYAVDRAVLAGDRTRPGHAYVAYMRLIPNLPLNNAIVVSHTEDGGRTWAAPGIVSQVPGAASIVGSLLSLDDGSLLHVYRLVPGTAVATTVAAQIAGMPLPLADETPPGAIIVAARSTDLGASWSTPVFIGAHDFPGSAVTDADTGLLIDFLVVRAALAPDGTVYVAWQDRPDAAGLHHVYLARSLDGGASWIPAESIVEEPRPNFQLSLAVAADGQLGITFYDQRHDPVGGETSLADVWYRVSRDQGRTWAESHLAGPFDMRSTILPDGSSMNVGNPQALQALGHGFAAAFTVGRPLAQNAPMAVLFQSIR